MKQKKRNEIKLNEKKQSYKMYSSPFFYGIYKCFEFPFYFILFFMHLIYIIFIYTVTVKRLSYRNNNNNIAAPTVAESIEENEFE